MSQLYATTENLKNMPHLEAGKRYPIEHVGRRDPARRHFEINSVYIFETDVDLYCLETGCAHGGDWTITDENGEPA